MINKQNNTIPDALIQYLARYDLDLPVFLSLLTQSVHFVSGVVLVFLISFCLSLDLQGFYYTFGSLVAIQSMMDLDFQYVALVSVSHEWSRLALRGDGSICGDRDALSRLTHEMRIAFLWYSGVATLSTVIVGIGGYLLMSTQPHPGITWVNPWIAFVILNGAVIWMRAFVSVIEGCNQVLAVNKFRLAESIFRAIALWVTLLSGGELWAPAAAAAFSVICTLYFLLKHSHFFKSLADRPQHARVDWKNEIFPIQWRTGLSSAFLFSMGNCFNPIIFYYQGPSIAGKMGMSLALIGVLQNAAMAWMHPRRPHFGILAAKRQFKALDTLWLRTTIVSVALLAISAILAWLFTIFMNRAHISFGDRFLPPLPLLGLLAWALLRHISSIITMYLRAHMRDPTAWINAVASIASIGATWYLARISGPGAVAVGILTVSILSVTGEVFLWQSARKRWHADDS